MRDEKEIAVSSSLIPHPSSLHNYRLTIQYDGTDFHGWQIQEGRRTVQGELTRALSLIEGGGVTVHGAGRTDAGVHAEGQVASARLRREFDPERLRAAVNGNVAADLRVIEVRHAPEDFHARYDAKGKTYCYRVRVQDPVTAAENFSIVLTVTVGTASADTGKPTSTATSMTPSSLPPT